MHDKMFEVEIIMNDWISSQKSQETSPRKLRTNCSQASDHTRKYHLNCTSFTHTKSIHESPRTCKMIVLEENVISEYRFPSPPEVRLSQG